VQSPELVHVDASHRVGNEIPAIDGFFYHKIGIGPYDIVTRVIVFAFWIAWVIAIVFFARG
jgi:hypothetical protein